MNSTKAKSGEPGSIVDKRAKFAYDRIRSWSPDWRGRVVSRVKGLPVQIRTQGLTTVVATLLREDTSESRELANMVADWLLKNAPHLNLSSEAGKTSAYQLLDGCVRAERPSYIAAQREALAFVEQVKLLSDALYGSEENSHGS